jgi:DNA helicase-2/ATP-dependent DNA helicase PcrA
MADRTPSPILDKLNDAQRQAVTAGNGPHLILAGPGSGKTRVLTHRAAYLIQEMGVHPYRIMAVTFTNKAAREMRDRIEQLLSEQKTTAPGGLTIGTFHAICARFLRIEAAHTPYSQDYAIFDTGDQLDVVKQACNELNIDPKRFSPRSLLSAISRAKNELLTPEAFADRAGDYFSRQAAKVYARYQELLLASNAMDFDDLLMQAVILFTGKPEVLEKYQNRLAHILVDEFQDTNYAQYALVRLLAAPKNNIFAVGDPDQSIYAFRGADYRNVLRFEKDYPDLRKILLEQNYRSVQNVLDAAMAVIDRNPHRTPKRLFTERGPGEPLTLYEAYNEDEEARYVVQTIGALDEDGEYALSECAVMYRTNAQSRALEEAFVHANMPYRIFGATRFYDRREVKDVLAYLRLIHNPNDSISLRRAINTPPRGIGGKTVEALELWAGQSGVTPGVALLSLRTGAEGPFSPRAREALRRFADLLAAWRALVEAGKPPLDIIEAVLTDTAFEGYLRNSGPDGDDRWENVLQLRERAADFGDGSLADFLIDTALVSDVDIRDSDQPGPSLMTLHSAKGLEFPVVFIVGLEDGILPHSRSIEADMGGNDEALPEERRLMYVGLTRAKDRLYLTYATQRWRMGDANPPSRFLYDLPPDLVIGSALLGGRRGNLDAFERAFGGAAASGWVPPSLRASRPTDTPARFRAGQRVNHPVFGEGIVIAAKRFGGQEEVEVQFGAGRKRIDGDFLTPLDG